MPTLSFQNSAVAVGASVTNILAGSQYEYLPFDALLEIGIIQSIIGGLVTIYSGMDVLAEEQPVAVGATVNTFPKYPDDFVFSDEAAAGDRLRVQIRNAGAGVNTFNTIIRITPM